MPKLYHNGRAWQVPGQQDKGAARIDVPNPPAELAAWLNARATPASIDGGGEAAVPPSHASGRETQLADQAGDPLDRYVSKEAAAARTRELAEAEHKAKVAAAALERGSADAIAAWIFDQAKPHQVEQLFAAIGTRFHELRKEASK